MIHKMQCNSATPAMQAGLTKRVMRIEDIVNLALIEAPKKEGLIKRKSIAAASGGKYSSSDLSSGSALNTGVYNFLNSQSYNSWFSHELAHIIDYETMSDFKFFRFTLRYIFNLKFRFFVEKRINAFACNNGFAWSYLGYGEDFFRWIAHTRNTRDILSSTIVLIGKISKNPPKNKELLKLFMFMNL